MEILGLKNTVNEKKIDGWTQQQNERTERELEDRVIENNANKRRMNKRLGKKNE